VGDVALLVHVFVHQIAAHQSRLPFWQEHRKSTESTERAQRAQREVRRTSSTFLHVRRTLLTFHFALLFHGPFHLLHPLHQQPPFLPARVLPRGCFLCLCLFLCFGLCHPFFTLLLHRVSDFPCFSFRVQCCDQQPSQQVSQTQSTINNCHHHQTRPTTATTTTTTPTANQQSTTTTP
jgi:hypothetical protein